MNKLLIFTFLLLYVFVSSNAQYDDNFGSTDECYGKTFTVVAWVLTDTLDKPNFTASRLNGAIATVNDYFSGICVDFKLCEFNVLPNHRQDKLTPGIHDDEISALYRKKNVINLYFVSEINPPGAGPCGYAPLGSAVEPSDNNRRDAIFLQKDCFGSGVLAHELGHYFGLYHTFETATFGVESADGTNCKTTGDLICDTQADPNGSNDAQCHLNPQQIDTISGLYYEPPVCNIMSYYNPTCDQFFTRGQLNRMLSIMKTGRKYLW
jgi:hypothetical protein